MTIRSEIASILSEPLVANIDFTMAGSLPITGAGFARVRDALLHNRIAIVSDPALPSGAGGHYNGTANRIGVEPSLTQRQLANSVQMRALFLHECTHALVDMMKARSTTVLTDEAAGYIVQLLYRLGRGQTWLRDWARRSSQTPVGAIFHEAIQVVDRYSLLRSCALVPASGYSNLRMAIQRHPVYRHHTTTELTTADGIP